MKFTEAKLEQAFIELLEIEGFPHCLKFVNITVFAVFGLLLGYNII
jgi:hypothetical protein